MNSKSLPWRLLCRRCISSLLPKSNPLQSPLALLLSSSSSHLTTISPFDTSFLVRRSLSSKATVDSSKNLVPVKPDSSMDDIEDVSTDELKTRINKFFENGDEEALPSIFEAIMARKMTGKHDDSDDELMKELQSKTLDGNDQGEAYQGEKDEKEDDDYEFEDEVSDDEESDEDDEDHLFKDEVFEDEESEEDYEFENEVSEAEESDEDYEDNNKIKLETSTRKLIE